MKKILCLLFFLAASILVSFRGGNISYLLFYFSLLLPASALLYSIYVYCRFRIVQDVSRVVVKSEEVPYRLVLANEDPLALMTITLHFYDEMVTMEDTSCHTDKLFLPPRQKLQVDTQMYCSYRGTYPVGVKTVSVTDFLGIFTIRFPMNSQIRLTAKPRILTLEHLLLSLPQQDQKNQLFSMSRTQDLADFDLRTYIPGDPLKYIHWKNSAKTGELLLRRQMPDELSETVIFLDLSPISGNFHARLQTEDNIIEAGLSFIHDYYGKNIPIRVVFMTDRLEEISVDQADSFDDLYQRSAELPFSSKAALEDIFSDYLLRFSGTGTFLLVTAWASEALLQLTDDNACPGNEILLIQTGELPL